MLWTRTICICKSRDHCVQQSLRCRSLTITLASSRCYFSARRMLGTTDSLCVSVWRLSKSPFSGTCPKQRGCIETGAFKASMSERPEAKHQRRSRPKIVSASQAISSMRLSNRNQRPSRTPTIAYVCLRLYIRYKGSTHLVVFSVAETRCLALCSRCTGLAEKIEYLHLIGTDR
jgi:hypothetical protein